MGGDADERMREVVDKRQPVIGHIVQAGAIKSGNEPIRTVKSSNLLASPSHDSGDSGQ